MAWLAVDNTTFKDENIYEEKPYRATEKEWYSLDHTAYVKLPKGSIEKLIGRKLTWADEPVELS